MIVVIRMIRLFAPYYSRVYIVDGEKCWRQTRCFNTRRRPSFLSFQDSCVLMSLLRLCQASASSTLRFLPWSPSHSLYLLNSVLLLLEIGCSSFFPFPVLSSFILLHFHSLCLFLRSIVHSIMSFSKLLTLSFPTLLFFFFFFVYSPLPFISVILLLIYLFIHVSNSFHGPLFLHLLRSSSLVSSTVNRTTVFFLFF